MNAEQVATITAGRGYERADALARVAADARDIRVAEQQAAKWPKNRGIPLDARNDLAVGVRREAPQSQHVGHVIHVREPADMPARKLATPGSEMQPRDQPLYYASYGSQSGHYRPT